MGALFAISITLGGSTLVCEPSPRITAISLEAPREWQQIAIETFQSAQCGTCDYFVPAFRNGRSIGIRVFAVHKLGLDQLGLRNGDVIVGIDEIKIDTLDNFLRAAARVRDPRLHALALILERRDKPLRITLQFVD
ncbi:MAG: hypothetical protein AAFU77_09100 [Myxococcota bacterium]